VFDDQLISEMAEEVALHGEDHDRRLEILVDCMNRLPHSKRDLLDRRYRYNQSVDQIARSMLKAPNVVSASLYRLRKALLECIESSMAAL
jgi:RNA polymerase sigma-70 factor, ECF subfamily